MLKHEVERFESCLNDVCLSSVPRPSTSASTLLSQLPMLCFASACPTCGQVLVVDIVNLNISVGGCFPSQLSGTPISSCSAEPFVQGPMLRVPPYLPNLSGVLTDDCIHAEQQCPQLPPGAPDDVAAVAPGISMLEQGGQSARRKVSFLSREHLCALETAARGPCPSYPPPARKGTTLLLSGVPFEATHEDIQVFLGKHMATLANTLPWSRTLQCIHQKSGCAIVQFATPEAARDCWRELDSKLLWDRCIKIVPHSQLAENQAVRRAENPAKRLSRCRQSKEYIERVLQEKEEDVERVLQECRAYLCKMDLNRAMISSVGAALSGDCRTILRENGLSLKRILESFPNDFEVSRIVQGQDVVYWHGAGSAAGMSSSHSGYMNKVVRWMMKKCEEKVSFEEDAAGRRRLQVRIDSGFCSHE